MINVHLPNHFYFLLIKDTINIFLIKEVSIYSYKLHVCSFMHHLHFQIHLPLKYSTPLDKGLRPT